MKALMYCARDGKKNNNWLPRGYIHVDAIVETHIFQSADNELKWVPNTYIYIYTGIGPTPAVAYGEASCLHRIFNRGGFKFLIKYNGDRQPIGLCFNPKRFYIHNYRRINSWTNGHDQTDLIIIIQHWGGGISDGTLKSIEFDPSDDGRILGFARSS